MWEMDFLIFKIDGDIKEEARLRGLEKKKEKNSTQLQKVRKGHVLIALKQLVIIEVFGEPLSSSNQTEAKSKL